MYRWMSAICILWIVPGLAQEIMKKCPGCQYVEKRQDARYCMHCGQKLEEIEMKRVLLCPKCDVPIDKGGTYCSHCGAKGKWSYVPVTQEGYEPLPKKTDGDEIFQKEPDPPPAEEKEIPILVYPDSKLEKEYNVDENLYHTAKQRTIVRRLFICPGSLDEVEAFYRAHYPKLSIIKAVAHDCFCLLNLKLQSPQEEIHIHYYGVTPLKSPEVWETKRQRLKTQFAEKLEPAQKLEKKMEALQQRYQEGKIGYPQMEEQLCELQESYSILTNSTSYWNTKMMEQSLTLEKNLLLITHTTKK